ncbi:MAG: hypothetical protein LUC31_02505 [Coprobacillus sp.]|nr:hypothetical protein [Coprobacillus sp.]
MKKINILALSFVALSLGSALSGCGSSSSWEKIREKLTNEINFDISSWEGYDYYGYAYGAAPYDDPETGISYSFMDYLAEKEYIFSYANGDYLYATGANVIVTYSDDPYLDQRIDEGFYIYRGSVAYYYGVNSETTYHSPTSPSEPVRSYSDFASGFNSYFNDTLLGGIISYCDENPISKGKIKNSNVSWNFVHNGGQYTISLDYNKNTLDFKSLLLTYRRALSGTEISARMIIEEANGHDVSNNTWYGTDYY